MMEEVKYCKTRYCTNTARKGKGPWCFKCEHRRYRKKYPYKSAYQNLCSNAKRRGLAVGVTLQEFEVFCIETNYLELKGLEAHQYSIHRPIEEIGYEVGNMVLKRNDEHGIISNQHKKKKWSTRVVKEEGDPF